MSLSGRTAGASFVAATARQSCRSEKSYSEWVASSHRPSGAVLEDPCFQAILAGRFLAWKLHLDF
jgi:hypothetical protein